MRWKLLGLAVCAGIALAGAVSPRLRSAAAPKKSEFAGTTIDVGLVVSDVEKAVKFYTEAIGFKEVKGFEVPAEMAADSGLTAGKPFKVRVLVLEDTPTATKVKLIEMPQSKSKKNDNEHIDSELGIRYLTIYVTDMNAATNRLNKAGVKPLAKGPIPLPKGFPEGVFLALVRDPDGNLIELIGPRK